MVHGLEHTAIASPDSRKLAHWYVDHLGFVINYDSGQTLFVRAPNGSMLEIITAEGDRTEQTLKTPGIRHLAIAVDDFDNVYAGLKAKNVNFLAEPFEFKGNRVVFFTDGDGNYLHLLQRAEPLPEKI
jgi:glyoxylase I family protein